MSKRITLTDSEIYHIVLILRRAREQTFSASYPVIESGEKTLQDIIDKLEHKEQTND